MKVQVADPKAEAFTHRDGTRYPLTEGTFEALPRHENDIEAADRYEGAVRVLPLSFGFSRAAGTACRCGFQAFAAMKGRSCPRCGSVL